MNQRTDMGVILLVALMSTWGGMHWLGAKELPTQVIAPASKGKELINKKATDEGHQFSKSEVAESDLEVGAEVDLTSGRQMELGVPNPFEKTSKKESTVLMSDPAMKAKWGLKKTDAKRAWEISQGSKDIIVAIIDTGIDPIHRDIYNNLWKNPGETGKDSKGRNKATNGIDDDKNGYVDDIHGWNFVHNNHDLKDNHGHGTHIAGIVGAEGGNGIGISGVSPKVSLMVLKYYDPKSSSHNNLRNTISAIQYAVKMNAQIINYSGGGLEFSQDEFKAIKSARANGILFVAAAGNEQSNSDQSRYYPADYDLPNIISVTAIDQKTKILPSSNYGIKTVDIAAPGLDIYSTLPGNSYGTMTGTSQATAFVSGVAALVMANNNQFSAKNVKDYILATGDEIPSLINKTGTSKQLNSYKALSTLDQGVGLTGVMAANTKNLKPGAFSQATGTTGSSLDPALEQTREMATFGNVLLKALEDIPGE